MKTLSILTLGAILFTACQSSPTPSITSLDSIQISIPNESRQLLFVTTSDWSSREGRLQRYEKRQEDWQKVGQPVNIILGRNGLGWGRGLHTIPKDAKVIKKEGDGKSPAGLFVLGNGFGYNSFKIDFPYKTYRRTDHCVDDSGSQWYNQIIDSTKTTKDYKSFEHMKLNNNLYKYGIIVNHNPHQIAQGGSCIFMHIRSGNGKGTAGCTAMRESEIVEILKWLKEEEQPLLLQLPLVEIEKHKY